MKKKKPMCTVLVAMLILSITMVMTRVGADAPLPKLSVDPQTYTATQLGEVFTINITIANVHNLSVFQFKLGYNTTLLDALEAVEGPLPQPPVDCMIAIHDPEGYINIMVLCNPTEGNGTLMTITFNATYAGSASCTLHLYDTVLADINGDPITHEAESGNYEFVILSITVATNKPSYLPGEENVEINGNLTLNNSPHQGLVALEVIDPKKVIVIRTLQTGPDTPSGNITIVDVIPCNNWGQPQDTFKKGKLAYFMVIVRNNGTESKNVTIAFNAYDNNMLPLDRAKSNPVLISPGAQGDYLSGIIIPEYAETGTGKVYASALTLMPKQGGVPYCPEASATFQITGSSGGGEAPGEQGSENVGNYSLTFKLLVHNAKKGNYTVYASSSYQGTATSTQAINQTTFEVRLLGDVNDDGEVTATDLAVLKSFLTKIMLGLITMEEALTQVPGADLNGDDQLTATDMAILKSILTNIML